MVFFPLFSEEDNAAEHNNWWVVGWDSQSIQNSNYYWPNAFLTVDKYLRYFPKISDHRRSSQIIADYRRSSQIIRNHRPKNHINQNIDFENFEIIADHRRPLQIIADHRKKLLIIADHQNPTFGKEFWNHRRSSQIIGKGA
jgi:hypothetical protein